jgi:hypothetical protein
MIYSFYVRIHDDRSRNRGTNLLNYFFIRSWAKEGRLVLPLWFSKLNFIAVIIMHHLTTTGLYHTFLPPTSNHRRFNAVPCP